MIKQYHQLTPCLRPCWSASGVTDVTFLCRTAFGASSVETICGSLEVQLPCHVNVLCSLHLSQLVLLSPFYRLENPKHGAANHRVHFYSQDNRRIENTSFSLLLTSATVLRISNIFINCIHRFLFILLMQALESISNNP